MRVRGVLLLSLALLVACGEKPLPSYDLAGNTMGTTFNITLVQPATDTDLEALRMRIHDKLEHIENLASTYRNESALSLFNANPSTDWVTVHAELCDMVSAALDISAATEGAFDITVGPLVNLWGFGPAPQDSELPTDAEISAALANVGFTGLDADCEHARLRKSRSGIYLDLSGWAKGHAVDVIAAELDAMQLENYLIEIGGELRVRGYNAEHKAFSIAVEKPLLNNDIQYTLLSLTDVAVATSGDYRNFFMHDGHRYSHTIDPRTGRPVSHTLSGVTVISRSTAYADALATALLVLGPEDGPALAEELAVAAYFLIRSDDGMDEKSTSYFQQLRLQ